MPTENTLLIALVALTGILVLFQFIVLLGLLLAMRKGIQAAIEYGDDLKSKVFPVLTQSREILEIAKELIVRLEPRLESASLDLAAMTRTARDEAKRIQASTDEIRERVRLQAERVDGMTTNALNGLDHAVDLLTQAIAVPVRQISGVLAALKAIVETLRAPAQSGASRGSQQGK